MAKVSLAALQALQSLKFPGSAELARDIGKIVDSLRPSWGSNTMIDNATATTIASSGVGVLMAGTLVPGASSADMTMTAAGRFTFSGAGPIQGRLTGSICIASPTATDNVGYVIYKNGVRIDSTEGNETVNAANEAANIAVSGDVDMVDTDYLEIFVLNNSTTANVTVTDCNIFFESIIL